jgi:hypothetical protein
MGRLQKVHKGFVIQSTALALREPKDSFTVHVDIRKDHKAYSDDSHFESGQVFRSENDALEAGFQMGKEKVDAGFQPKNIVVNAEP